MKNRDLKSIVRLCLIVLFIQPLMSLPAWSLGANPSLYWTGSPVVIPVCWEADVPADANARFWVRDAIERSWSRHARVNFVQWDTCTNNEAGVHIRNLEQAINANEIPANSGSNANAYGAVSIGKGLNGVNDGVTLAFCNGQVNREACVRSTAIHEFGHVLGFHHSEERTDYTGPACGNPLNPDGTMRFPAAASYGQYDIDSVMSYCGGGDVRLSPGDIAGVQRAYGRRISGTLASPRAKCLSNNEFNPGSNQGQNSFLWDCWEDYDNQEWDYSAANAQFRIRPGFVSGAPEACLDHWGHQDFTRADDCHGGGAQQFSFEDIEIRGFGGKCLDLAAGNTSNGTALQSWDCGSSLANPVYNSNQRWNIQHEASGRVTIHFAANPSKCVTVKNWGTANGTQVYLWDCIYPDAQRFTLTSNGSIQFTYNSVTKCLDYQGPSDSQFTQGIGGPSNGAGLQLFTCGSSTLNQKFNFTGQIRSKLNTVICLDRQWGGDSNGVVTWGYTCGTQIPLVDTHAQVWDYYFK